LVDVSGDHKEILSLPFDLVFLALHGEFGEDGTVQRLLDHAGIIYTGSDAESSAVAINKQRTKDILRKNNILVPNGCCLLKSFDVYRAMHTAGLRLPVVVKPNSRGSSISVTIAHTDHELIRGIEQAFLVDEEVLVEEYIEGRELTVGMACGKILPIVEMKTSALFYDYHAKYHSPDTKYLCPAPFSKDESDLIQSVAGSSLMLINARDLARVDILYHSNGAVVLEINTLPGFTSHSLLPFAAQSEGICCADLCISILQSAWRRKVAF